MRLVYGKAGCHALPGGGMVVGFFLAHDNRKQKRYQKPFVTVPMHGATL